MKTFLLIALLATVALCEEATPLFTKESLVENWDLLVAGSSGADWSNCGTVNGFTIDNFDVSPWPMKKSTNITFALTGTATQEIPLSKGSITIIYKGHDLHTFTSDAQNPFFLPGTHVYSKDYTVPWFVPDGTYTIELKSIGNNGETVACVSFPFTLQ